MRIQYIEVLLTLLCVFSLSYMTTDKWVLKNRRLKPFLATRHEVNQIAEDLFVPGNILFTEFQALLTTDGSNATVLVGKHYKQDVSREITPITSFVQTNSTNVFVSDSQNGCIRALDRVTNSTSIVAGNCVRLSYGEPAVDGPMLMSQFSVMNSMAYYNNSLYVTEVFDKRIRKIDFCSGNVTTVLTQADLHDNIFQPWGIAIVPSQNLAYVTIAYGIAILDLATDTFTYVTGNKATVGSKDGPLRYSTWYYDTSIALYHHTLFVVDVYGYSIRVIDLDTNYVYTVIKGIPKLVAVSVINCTLYVSTRGLISTLDLPIWFGTNFTADKIVTKAGKASFRSTDAVVIAASVAGGCVAVMLGGGIGYYIRRRRVQKSYGFRSRAEYSTFSEDVHLTSVDNRAPKKLM